jgi:type IV conjugative transfer system lipoprotein TraV
MKKQLIKNMGFYSLLKLFLVSLSILTVNGCAVHKASFDCPNGKGMGCGSMIDVHKSIKDNSFNQIESYGSIKAVAECKSCQKNNSKDQNSIVRISGDDKSIYFTKDKVSRSHDTLMRIWFNSYFDEYNNFHDSQYIYTIIQPAQWLVQGEKIS